MFIILPSSPTGLRTDSGTRNTHPQLQRDRHGDKTTKLLGEYYRPQILYKIKKTPTGKNKNTKQK